jgi:hypothetical protein
MTDDRFYERAGPFSLAEIAQPKKTDEEQD